MVCRLTNRGIVATLVLGALFLSPGTRPLVAQTIELRLRADSSDVPVVGAIIRLLGGDGIVFQGLTDEAGRLAIRAPAPGSYRIRIDRIGHSGLTTEIIPLEAGQVLRKVISLGAHPVRLPTIDVRSNPRCDAPGPHGEIVLALWEEVQKALTAQVISAAQGLPLHAREFVRELDRDGRSLREWVTASQLTREPPFRSLAPGDLARRGFAYNVADTAVFAAPDAALLLSGEFVSTHCFYAREDERGLAGLGFQPLTGRRVPDVKGTLWLDRSSAQLRYLEFSYTGLPDFLRRSELGGRIQFTPLPGGQWIVNDWYIRMPRFEARSTRNLGYTDNGGRATLVGDTSSLVHHAVLAGRVYDSTTGHGLAGASVWLNGAADTMTTDSSGRFESAFRMSGPQIASVKHPKLGLLGEPTDRAVVLSVGDTSFVEFSVPPIAAFVRTYCPRTNQRQRVNLVGTAMKLDGSPAAGWDVDATRLVAGVQAPIIGMRGSSVSKVGTFVLCDVPAYGFFSVTLRKGKRMFGELTIELQGESRWIELRERDPADSSTTTLRQPSRWS